MSGASKKSFGDVVTGDMYPQLAQEINEKFKIGRIYSVNEIITFFKKKGVSSSIVKDFVFYLIIKEFFEIEEYRKDLIQSKIIFKKKISLKINPI